MGVKYYKEFVEIIEHFASGIMRIDDFYKFIDMTLGIGTSPLKLLELSSQELWQMTFFMP
ncbi:MAG TPA: hypothetical protein VIK72_02435 [Clostridiaceae bacterium]